LRIEGAQRGATDRLELVATVQLEVHPEDARTTGAKDTLRAAGKVRAERGLPLVFVHCLLETGGVRGFRNRLLTTVVDPQAPFREDAVRQIPDVDVELRIPALKPCQH